MDLDYLREYCLSKKWAVEDFPFDEVTMVFKVGSKIFALTDSQTYPLQVNLKCDPEKAIELREEYESIIPGWHMNKKHWNTLILDGNLPETLIKELIDHSYDLVLSSLSKKEKGELEVDH
jgi:predicted DNA-binding protein (MmcQ/YjbR family)